MPNPKTSEPDLVGRDPRAHPADCGYHVDQYPWECTCGRLPAAGGNDRLIAEMTDVADWIEKTKPQGLLYDSARPCLRQAAEAIVLLREESAELTKALTGLTCGGSEFFVQRDGRFVADIPACVAYVGRVREGQHAVIRGAIGAKQDMQARALAAEAERDRLRGALEERDAFIASVEDGLTWNSSDTQCFDRIASLFRDRRSARLALSDTLGGEKGSSSAEGGQS